MDPKDADDDSGEEMFDFEESPDPISSSSRLGLSLSSSSSLRTNSSLRGDRFQLSGSSDNCQQKRTESQKRKDLAVVSDLARRLSSVPSLSLSFTSSEKILVDQQIQKVFGECSKALFVGGDTAVDQLRKKKQSSVCGAVWKKGKMAYRCRDCQTTQNSCICVDCFREGDHEGHDYYLHSSAGGGCCDCGDPAAWDPKGFCSRHCGMASQKMDLTTSLPVFSSFQVGSPLSSSPAFSSHPIQMTSKALMLASPARDVIKLLMEMLALHLDAILEDRKGSKYYCSGRVEHIAAWAYETCTFGDDIRRIFCEVVASTVVLRDATFAHLFDSNRSFLNDFFESATLSHAASGPQLPLLDLLLQGSCMMQNKAGDNLCNFILDMLHDSVFKVLFAKVYVANYSDMLSMMMGVGEEKKIQAIDSTLSTIGVQLFTSSNLAEFLVREEKFMDQLLECLQMFFFQCSTADDDGNLIVDCRHDMVQKGGYCRFFSDLGSLLKFPSVSEHMVFHSSHLFGSFLQFASVLHGMNPNTRRTLDHVEYEHEDWRYAFALEQRLNMLIPYIVEGFENRRKELPSTMNSSPFYSSMVTEVREALETAFSSLLSLQERESSWGVNSSQACQYGQVFFGDYVVSMAPVSFHIPLHRIVGAMLKEIVSVKEDGVSLKDYVKLESESLLFMISHPLRIRSLLAQIQAGMWKRNGEVTMHGQLHVYLHPVLSHESLAQDILLLQAGAVLLDSPSFLMSVLEHFELQEWFDLLPPPESGSEEARDDETYNVVLAERFFHLILTIAFNRHMAGSEDHLRSHVIQWLCVGHQTFSNLINRLHFEAQLNKTREMEALMKEVAERRPPVDSNGRRSCGGYSVKPEFWAEFDPTFLFYDQHHLERAFESRKALYGKDEDFVLPMRSPTSQPLLPMLRPLPKIIFCALFHRLLFGFLYNAVTKSDRYSDKILDMVLYLLMFIVQIPAPEEAKEEAEQSFKQNLVLGENPVAFPSGWDFFENSVHQVMTPTGPRSLLGMVCDLLEREDLKARHATMKQFLELYKRAGSEQKEAVENLLQKGMKSGDNEGGVEADRRKKAIMAKFSMMQKQFDAKMMEFSSDEDEDEDEEMDEDGDMEGEDFMCGVGGEKAEEEGELSSEEDLEVSESSFGREIGQCELCKEETVGAWHKRPMGLVGLLTRSNALSSVGRKSKFNFTVGNLISWPKKSERESSIAEGWSLAGKRGKRKAEVLETEALNGIQPPSHQEEKEMEELLSTFSEESLENALGIARGVMGEDDEDGSGRALSLLLSYIVRQNPVRMSLGGLGSVEESSDEESIFEDLSDFDDFEVDATQSSGPSYAGYFRSSGSSSSSSGSSSSTGAATAHSTFTFPHVSLSTSLLMSQGLGVGTGLHIQSCGHIVHMDCFERYMSSRSQRHDPDENLMDHKAKEFWCPVCRRLNNVLIPVVPSTAQSGGLRSSASSDLRGSKGLSRSGSESLSSFSRTPPSSSVQFSRSPYSSSPLKYAPSLKLSNLKSSGPLKSSLRPLHSQYVLEDIEETKVASTTSKKNVLLDSGDWMIRSLVDASLWAIEHRNSDRESSLGGLFCSYYRQMQLIQSRKTRKGPPKSGVKTLLGLTNSLCYSVMCLEVQTRTGVSERVPFARNVLGSQKTTLRDLSHSIFFGIRFDFLEDPTFLSSAPTLLIHTLQWFLSGYSNPEGASKPVPRRSFASWESSRESKQKRGSKAMPTSWPLLTREIFPLLVRWVMTCQAPNLPSAFYDIMKVCYLAAVTQAVLYLYLCVYPSSKSKREEGSFSASSSSIRQPSNTISVYQISDYIREQYPSIQPSQLLQQEVEMLCLPFLRSCSMFLYLCLQSKEEFESGDNGDGWLFEPDGDIHSQFEAQCAYLRLPGLSCLIEGASSIPTNDPSLESSPFSSVGESFFSHQSNSTFSLPKSVQMSHLIARWVLAQKEVSSTSNLRGHSEDFLPYALPFERFQLVELPKLFQDLFHNYMNTKCNSCNTVPQDAALCLVCGSYVCFKENCCKRESHGESFRHAVTCGAGSAAFLSLRTSGVYFVRDGRCVLWGSPYLDSHGEEDVLLDRGRPMYLDDLSYRSIAHAFLSHTLDDIIMQPSDSPLHRRAKSSRSL